MWWLFALGVIVGILATITLLTGSALWAARQMEDQ